MTLADAVPLLAETAGALLPYLEDPAVMEIMANPDERLFIERFGVGIERVADLDATTLDTFLRCVASLVHAEWRDSSPSLHAALPALGLRIQAERPPLAPGPMMTLRKHPQQVFPLEDFVQKGILTVQERAILETAIAEGQTVLISGSTGSAKTSLLNALLHALQDSGKRMVILEDDPELRCDAENTASLHTLDGDGGVGTVTMTDLVKKALRHRPDLLIIGEVRDGAALDMLKGFQTGHPGLASVHAESALGTLLRLEQLVQEVSVDPQRALIAEAVDVIVHLARVGRSWRATGLLAVDGLRGQEYLTRALA
jgi:type IV secretion system protein VirB11